MIEYTDAVQAILNQAHRMPPARRSISQATGYVLAEDVVSDINVVSYRNSAMDGFAVRSEWLSDGDEANPVVIPYHTTIFAGDTEPRRFSDGAAAKIMTGAPVPDGYDTVVKFEDTSYDEHQVKFVRPAKTGANVREPGEDIKVGETLLAVGERIGPLHIGMLASIGRSEVTVFDKPSVLIATTGNELVAPGLPLPPGAVYNSNLYTIDALVSPLSRCTRHLTSIGDSRDQLRAVMDNDSDVIVTSGGVSAGERDMVIEATQAAGFETVFHKVRIKPGKPLYFARRKEQILIGLPGNPLSTAVTCAVFVLPALKKMSGWRDYNLDLKAAQLAPSSLRRGGRLLIWPGSFARSAEGLTAEFSAKRSSAALSALLRSDGLIFQDAANDETTPSVAVVPWDEILGG